MKKCTGCGEEKPLDEFYESTRGRDAKCKKCRSEVNRAYYSANKEKSAERTRQWEADNPDRRRELSRRSYVNRKLKRAETMAAYWQRNPERKAAQTLLHAALKEGRLVRPESCEKCSKSCSPDGHHPDYAKPLLVVWLCRSCHRALHRQEA